jgi:uncharacterized protein with von Willebrand factor type A (vWA) domain
MKAFYGEYQGSAFPTPDDLFSSSELMEFLLDHGEQGLKAMEKMLKDENHPEIIEQMIKDGFLEKDAQGRLRLTPKALKRMSHRALLEVFANLRGGYREGHEKLTTGQGGPRLEGTKPYEFGDPIAELDLHQTLKNALKRHGLPQRDAAGQAPITLDEGDLELHLQEGQTSCSTVVLLDQSGSMMRYGRWHAAKRVALAMRELISSRFPQDTLDFVGFYSGASRISAMQLPLLMPKPVTTHDYQVRQRVPLRQLEHAPQHFTNLQMGLQMARKILRRRGGNRQIFIITDGQPTAHVEGEYVYLLYPPDKRSAVATLSEASLATREGCRIATFALIEDYWGMDWVGFVEQMNRLTHGVAFYTSSSELAGCIMESYLSGRKHKAYLGA